MGSVKVLHVVTSLRAGGAEALIVRLLPHLAHQSGWRFDVCTLVPGGLLAAEAGSAGIHVTSLNCRGDYSISAPFLLKRLVQDGRYDLVHSHLTYPGLCSALLPRPGRSPRLFFTEHSIWNRRRNLPLLRYLERPIYARFDRIIAVSPAVRSTLISWLGEKFSDRIAVVENGVPLPRDRELDRQTRSLAVARLGLHGLEPPVLISVGSLRAQKAPLDLIEMCSHLCAKGERFTCLVVGDGPLRADVSRAISRSQLGQIVSLLGERPDVQHLLSLADVFVMLSRSEGLPVAMLEAMAAGLPIVATAVGGIANVIVDQENGLLVQPGRPGEAARAVGRLLSSPELRTHLGTQARTLVAERFSMETMASRILSEYRSAGGGSVG